MEIDLTIFSILSFFCLFSRHGNFDRNDTRQLTAILKELRDKVVKDDTKSYVNVRRNHLWEDTVRYVNRKRFDPKAAISVKFADDDGTSEGAVDLGGPRREFLRLLLREANSYSGIFHGPEDRRVLMANFQGRSLYYRYS